MKLGMVGTGFIVRQQLAQMAQRKGYQVVALAGTPSTEDQVHELANQYDIPGRYTSYMQMIKHSDADTIYVGVPNSLHLAVTRAGLEAGKNVICEKPMASNYRQAQEMSELARESGLYLWEAVSTDYQPNFHRLRELLPRIGTVKIVSVNYSQYSSRYDAFCQGQVLPAFDPKKAGGAPMDLGLYNLHYVLGLFGKPQAVSYTANVERGIDTSGVVTLDYGSFKAMSVAAKDCAAPCSYVIQGDKGYLLQNTPANFCGPITLHLNDGTEEHYDDNGFTDFSGMWDAEFASFQSDVESGSTEHCYQMLDETLLVSRVQTEARLSAGVHFPEDEA